MESVVDALVKVAEARDRRAQAVIAINAVRKGDGSGKYRATCSVDTFVKARGAAVLALGKAISIVSDDVVLQSLWILLETVRAPLLKTENPSAGIWQ